MNTTDPRPNSTGSPPSTAAQCSVRISAAFAAAVMAGIPITSTWDALSGEVTLSTVPVDVWLDGGIIKVFSAPNNKLTDAGLT